MDVIKIYWNTFYKDYVIFLNTAWRNSLPRCWANLLYFPSAVDLFIPCQLSLVVLTERLSCSSELDVASKADIYNS